MLSAVELIPEFVMIAVAVALAIPAAVLLMQVTAPHRFPPEPDRKQARPRVQVIIPAHDEQRCIGKTLRSIQSQLVDGDRCLVVADNCEDATARIAREHGALVVERHDAQNRGKGFAIDYGKQHIGEASEFDVVILIDADCELGEGAIETLATRCIQSDRPIQAAYLMGLPHGHQYGFGAVKVLAWHIKNYVRPLGGLFLGFPCQLTGSGMAFPKQLFSRTSFATANVVEDLKLGIDLAIDGYPPVFCPRALILSDFPVQGRAMLAQRKRWEHGYLALMGRYIPRLVAQSIRQRRPALLAMAADLAVPPLVLFVLLSLIALVIALAFLLVSGQALPLQANLIQSSLLLVAVVVIWFRHGRNLVSRDDLRQLPIYVFSKLPLYASFVRGRQTHWIRTDRDDLPT